MTGRFLTLIALGMWPCFPFWRLMHTHTHNSHPTARQSMPWTHGSRAKVTNQQFSRWVLDQVKGMGWNVFCQLSNERFRLAFQSECFDFLTKIKGSSASTTTTFAPRAHFWRPQRTASFNGYLRPCQDGSHRQMEVAASPFGRWFSHSTNW